MSHPRMSLPRTSPLLASLLLAGGAFAQSFEPVLLDGDGLLVGDAVRRARAGGLACGLGVPPGQEALPTLWDGTTTTLLPLLPGDETGEANGFDSSGLVVGTSTDVVPMGGLTFFFEHATVWQGGVPTPLEALVVSGPPLELQRGVDVNDAGTILGWGRDAAIPALRAFTVAGGVLTELAALTPTGSVEPTDLNGLGAACGTALAPVGFDHAVLWSGGALVDLHVAGGVPGATSQAFALNDAGAVVGVAEFDPGGPIWEEAALWLPGQPVQELPGLGGNQSWAFSVNAQGDVVGAATTPAPLTRATLWRAGALIDLNDTLPPGSGWTLLTARGIAADGRIYGEGAFGGAIRAYVLVPQCESCASYCVSTPNSTGAPALISAVGWESVAANDFGLRASPLPVAQPGLFFFGPEAVMVPFGNGVRCVAPGARGLFRLPPTAADAGGELATAVDLLDPALGALLVPGSTWRFQAWYRDPAAGGFGFDLSDGLAVQFLP